MSTYFWPGLPRIGTLIILLLKRKTKNVKCVETTFKTCLSLSIFFNLRFLPCSNRELMSEITIVAGRGQSELFAQIRRQQCGHLPARPVLLMRRSRKKASQFVYCRANDSCRICNHASLTGAALSLNQRHNLNVILLKAIFLGWTIACDDSQSTQDHLIPMPHPQV